MQHVLLIRYAEIHLKGLNRGFFERLLIQNIRTALAGYSCKVSKADGRFYVTDLDEALLQPALQRLTRVFGIHSVSVAALLPKNLDDIVAYAVEQLQGHTGSFRVNARRSDKSFPLNSMELGAEIGGRIVEALNLPVDLHHPQLQVHVEIRENAYVYTQIFMGAGGMPVGSNGKAAVLLSGGIDSPVAAWMIAKRGVEICAVHFHSFPYTSEQAKQKVVDLLTILSQWCGKAKLFVVPFTEIQQQIYEKCPESEITVLMRRCMMRIAQRIALQQGCGALVTGESIGQVASQTLEALNCTNSVVTMPVFRPLIGMDKIEIIERAQKIGTFETSNLPYEDCCTIFVPKHPVTHPKIERMEKSETVLDIETLIENAVQNVETIVCTEQ